MSCNDVELEAMTTAQESTLVVLHEGTPIFTSHGTRLHPLFELETYLALTAFPHPLLRISSFLCCPEGAL
jgi:hypothetical protein